MKQQVQIMLLFLRISFFVFNTFTFCKSTNKTETNFLTTVKLPASVNTEVPSVVWPQNQVSNLTRNCNLESNRNNGLSCHDSTAIKNVSKRLAIVLNKNLTTTNLPKINPANLVTTKSKHPKSVATTTKSPLNTTKPAKSIQKNN